VSHAPKIEQHGPVNSVTLARHKTTTLGKIAASLINQVTANKERAPLY
jgi:hypothetical protein